MMIQKEEQLEKEKEHFCSQYHQSVDTIFRFVQSRLLFDAQATEEVVQEIYTHAWLSRAQFQNKSSYTTWVCAIAKNKISDFYRNKMKSEKHIIELGTEWDAPSDFDMMEHLVSQETRKSVLEALNNLVTTYRYCLVMKYIDEYSTKEIAKILGKSAKAVERLLSRAKVCFKKELINIQRREK